MPVYGLYTSATVASNPGLLRSFFLQPWKKSELFSQPWKKSALIFSVECLGSSYCNCTYQTFKCLIGADMLYNYQVNAKHCGASVSEPSPVAVWLVDCL